MGWCIAVFFLIILIINNGINKENVKVLNKQLEQSQKEFENFKNADPEQKRLKLVFEKQLSNIKSINVNIKELVDILNYAKKKQTRLNLVIDYNKKIIHIAGKGFDTTIQGN